MEPRHVNFDAFDDYDLVSSDDLISMCDIAYENSSTDKLPCYKQFLSLKHYEDQWNELFSNPELDLEKLKQKCTQGQLRTSSFRSICWRCLLGILHKDSKQWLCQLETYRKHYDEVCLELEHNPWNVKDSNPNDNPLSQESESVWQKYFCDEELKAVIHQDVKRTFPDTNFFRREHIQQMMVRMLFLYARQNPALCYRQGMHEILAPIIFILYCDHQAFLHAKDINPDINEIMCEILNPEYLEQDAFSIFKYIMNHIECSYRINNVVTTSVGYFPVQTQKYGNNSCQNEVLMRLEYIKKNILQERDPELSAHLEKLDISLQLFGIRWLRLLFGREFPLQDLLVLWDFIFANNFEIVNHILVAMLIAIRKILLMGDYTTCLSALMKYPNGVDVTYVIEYALHLQDSHKYPAPNAMHNPYFTGFKKSIVKSKTYVQENPEFPLPSSRIKKKTSRMPELCSGKPVQVSPGRNGQGDGITVCSAVNNQNVLRAELERARMIINIVHSKLVQFHSVLAENLQNNLDANVQLAVDGIYELSCLLKNCSNESNYDIETACEAGEIKETKAQIQHSNKGVDSEKLKPLVNCINSEKRPHTLPEMRKGPKSGELKVFKRQIGEPVTGAPMVDPLRLIKNLINDEYLNTDYESKQSTT